MTAAPELHAAGNPPLPPWTSRTARQLMPLLPLAFLVSCDVFYTAQRRAAADPRFDAAAAEALLRQRPDWDPDRSRAFDGHSIWCTVGRGEVHAGLDHEAGAPLRIASSWVGGWPRRAVLEASLRLQIELIEQLRNQCPSLPPATLWPLEWLRPPPADAPPAPGAEGEPRH